MRPYADAYRRALEHEAAGPVGEQPWRGFHFYKLFVELWLIVSQTNHHFHQPIMHPRAGLFDHRTGEQTSDLIRQSGAVVALAAAYELHSRWSLQIVAHADWRHVVERIARACPAAVDAPRLLSEHSLQTGSTLLGLGHAKFSLQATSVNFDGVGASLYALRHIQASMLIDVGIDVAGISRRLGRKVARHRHFHEVDELEIAETRF